MSFRKLMWLEQSKFRKITYKGAIIWSHDVFEQLQIRNFFSSLQKNRKSYRFDKD